MSKQQQQPSKESVVTPIQNQYLTNENRLTLLEQKLNHTYVFKNRLLALETLQVSGLPQLFHGKWQDIPNNKGLAILGDKLLDLHLWIQWRETGTSREQYSIQRSHVASNKNLDKVGREMGLDECVIRRFDSVQPVGVIGMATTVEAILGAVFQDAEAQQKGLGIDAVTKVASEMGLDLGSSG